MKIKDKIKDLAKLYDDGSDYFLPIEVQKKWFFEENPNGCIIVEKPELSPERTPGEYVATAKIYKDKPNDPSDLPDIQISNIARPGEDGISAYLNCQIKAVRSALKDLGYWVVEDDIVEKTKKHNEFVIKTTGINVLQQSSNDESGKTEKSCEESEDPKGIDKKTHNDSASDTEIDKAVEKDNKAEVVEKDDAKSGDAVNNSEKELDLNSFEDAMKLVISYRNYQGRTIGDLYNSKDPSERKILDWFATSNVAAERHPRESLASKTVLSKDATKEQK